MAYYRYWNSIIRYAYGWCFILRDNEWHIFNPYQSQEENMVSISKEELTEILSRNIKKSDWEIRNQANYISFNYFTEVDKVELKNCFNEEVKKEKEREYNPTLSEIFYIMNRYIPMLISHLEGQYEVKLLWERAAKQMVEKIGWRVKGGLIDYFNSTFFTNESPLLGFKIYLLTDEVLNGMETTVDKEFKASEYYSVTLKKIKSGEI